MTRPRHDPLPNLPAGAMAARRAAERALIAEIEARIRRRRGKPEAGGSEPCPVKPNRPLDLSGGAAAALEFDD